jgi:hypothetical protein
MSNILRCPFCGSTASGESDAGKFWVQCDDLENCGVTDGCLYGSPGEAESQWNRRVAPTQGADARPVAISERVSAPLSDEWIEMYALRHIAPNHPHMKSLGLNVSYPETAQFERVKAYTRAVEKALATRGATPSDAVNARLAKFLDVAAGEGYVFDGIDAGELFLELFPDYFKDAAIAPRNET